MPRTPAILLCLLVVPASCEVVKPNRGKWPPADFTLDLQYTVVENDVRQVRKSAKVFADGLVVYREADTTLRSSDGRIELPIYTRMCAYRMPWRSIRDLSRQLHRARVLDLKDPVPMPDVRNETHLVRFHLTYMGKQIDVVAQNHVVGLMNSVVRLVNTFLPPDHGITAPNMTGVADECHLQDVPEVTESLAGALSFHRSWLSKHATNPVILRDTFGLACASKDWDLAQECVRTMAESRPVDVPLLRQILRDCQAASAKDGPAKAGPAKDGPAKDGPAKAGPEKAVPAKAGG